MKRDESPPWHYVHCTTQSASGEAPCARGQDDSGSRAIRLENRGKQQTSLTAERVRIDPFRQSP